MARFDKEQRKGLIPDLDPKEKAAEFAELPISNADFEFLFTMLDTRLVYDDCDHTRRFTIELLRAHSLPEESVLRWLDGHGGYCDCEVLLNAEPVWEACKDYEPDEYRNRLTPG